MVPYSDGAKVTTKGVPSEPYGARVPLLGETEKCGEDLAEKYA